MSRVTKFKTGLRVGLTRLGDEDGITSLGLSGGPVGVILIVCASSERKTLRAIWILDKVISLS